MENEIQIGSDTYKIERLSAMKAFHVARRLAPVLVAIFKAGAPDLTKDDLLKTMAPAIADSLANLSDDDTEYVIFTCLAVVSKKQGPAWAPVTKNKQMMFDDMDAVTMLRLTSEVVQENMTGFFSSALATSATAAS